MVGCRSETGSTDYYVTTDAAFTNNANPIVSERIQVHLALSFDAIALVVSLRDASATHIRRHF